MKVLRVTVKHLLIQALIAMLWVGGTSAADAELLYEQPSIDNLNGVASQNAPNGFGDLYLAFDNFSLTTDALITEVQWLGTFVRPGIPGPITQFEIIFWSDESGLPGQPLESYVIPGNAGQQFVEGSSAAQTFSYTTDLPTPFAVEAETIYWLSIQPTLNDPPQWLWTFGTGGDGRAARIVRSNSPDPQPVLLDLAFALLGFPASNELHIEIDVKPGGFPNSINPASRGKIPVAILTTDTFDASTVDPATVRFGATGTEAAPVHAALEDVDGDGDIDLLLHFNTQETSILCGDTSASLTAATFGGQAIEGSETIHTVGCR